MMPVLGKVEINWLRGVYIVLFFCNAIFATMFKTIGQDLLSSFGTFADCDEADHPSCPGNQMIFRASVSISVFFLTRALLSRFGCKQSRQRTIRVLVWVEIPVFIGLLVGSFYIPSSFFDGYVPFTRVASGFFILFQIFSIVSVSYQIRDTLLTSIEISEKTVAAGDMRKRLFAGSVCMWRTAFLGVCTASLIVVMAGIVFLYMRFGDCSLGIAFTTITVVAAGLLISACISSWLEVGLLPPCVISAYLVLMCWQALVSNPNKTCENRDHPSPRQDEEFDHTDSVIINAVIAAFAMTWTSWRTSSAATKLFVRRGHLPPHRNTPVTRRNSNDQSHEFAGVVVVDMHPVKHMDVHSTIAVETTVEPLEPSRELVHEPWQFHSMMCLAGLYMAMVLTDWDSADGSSNDVSMWVKIVAQWVTILLFSWTLVAPKLFPDRDFS